MMWNDEAFPQQWIFTQSSGKQSQIVNGRTGDQLDIGEDILT
jgi:hypothetical protein